MVEQDLSASMKEAEDEINSATKGADAGDDSSENMRPM